MFGECAQQMRAYFEILEAGWMKPRAGKWFQGLDWLAEQLLQWDSSIREDAWQKLGEAFSAATTTKTRERISYVREGNRLAYLLSKALDEVLAATPDAESLEKCLHLVFARVREALTVFHGSIERDVTYGAAYYRGDRATIQVKWWMGFMAALIGDVLSGNAKLHERLISEDATYREMADAQTFPDVPRRVKEAREMYGRAG
jgi:hypothetical protein